MFRNSFIWFCFFSNSVRKSQLELISDVLAFGFDLGGFDFFSSLKVEFLGRGGWVHRVYYVYVYLRERESVCVCAVDLYERVCE